MWTHSADFPFSLHAAQASSTERTVKIGVLVDLSLSRRRRV